MKTLVLLALLFFMSGSVIVVADYFLGRKAEFLNAFSVFQRILGQDPSVSASLIAKKFGEMGELLAVVAVNLVVGTILTAASTRLFFKARRESLEVP